VTYHLDPGVKAKIVAPPSKDVLGVIAEVHPNYEGDEVLVLTVILRDEIDLSQPSEALGKQLAKIVTELRRRTAKEGVGLFPAVRFVHRSDLPARRKTA
jgi:hypothetical protein